MPSSEHYHITEPHPSVPASHYIHSGRGGAGNITHVNPKNITNPANASGPASLVKLTPPSPTSYFATGRGGAGNMHRERERAMFSFDEELAQQQRIAEHSAPVYHIGRGGAGNAVDEMKPRNSRQNSTSSNLSSNSSTLGRSSLEGAWERVSRTFSRH